MSQTKYSFWQLINEYKIEIPMIQRDYAQGREEGKIPQIREGILNSLHTAMVNDKPLDFDFIYGRIEKLGEKEKFIPIDGQQRLTTLFLLHWYLSCLDNIDNEHRILLGQFSYKTRISSDEFCQELVKQEAIQLKDSSIIKGIKDSPWFVTAWEKDPTVSSMLIMLESIHKKFTDTTGFFNKLIDPQRPVVTFQFEKMEQLGLDDNIYIRMNSRGKQLTEFENFKARFEQFLEKHHPTKKKDFSAKIDGVWTDFFWNHKIENLIDDPFMRIFNYISEIYYYKIYTAEDADVTVFSDYIEKLNYWENLYVDEKAVDFLFYVLDLFTKWNNTQSFFKAIFSSHQNEKGKVALFDDKYDLVSKCINKTGFDITEKVLLYFILEYSRNSNYKENDKELVDRLRVLRNRLSRVRQFIWVKSKHMYAYSLNLRNENMKKYLAAAEFLARLEIPVYNALLNGDEIVSFPSDSIDDEKVKATIIKNHPKLRSVIHKAEDNPCFKGSIHLMLEPDNYKQLGKLYSAFTKIWNIEDQTLILSVMLTEGFDGISIGGWSCLGDRWCFGHQDDWYSLVTRPKEVPLIALLKKYLKYEKKVQDPEKILNMIIDDWLELNCQNRDWRYYFIKYEEMFSQEKVHFAWGNNDFEIHRLNKKTAAGYHINPYVFTVAELVDNHDICYQGKCYAKGDDAAPLFFYTKNKNEIRMWCENTSWRIKIPPNYKLQNKLLNTLVKTNKKTEFILKETKNKDRIEIALKFIKAFI